MPVNRGFESVTKAKLTDKQEFFCREYLVDLNATQAAIRAGYVIDESPPKIKYYTYALICGLTNKVFYIGKGKGGRVFNHVKRRLKPNGNKSKNTVINSCLDSGKSVHHLILSTHSVERVAYATEEVLIDVIGFDNLTNISKAQMSEMVDNDKADLPSIYDFEIISDWAKSCLEIIRGKGGKIYFLGNHSDFTQINVMEVLQRASLNHERVEK